MHGGPTAMDVESSDFKTYRQVSKKWTRFASVALVVSVVLAIIAFGISIAALEEAEKDKTTVVEQRGTTGVANSNPNGRANSAGSTTSRPSAEPESDRALPGSRNYTGFRHPATGFPLRHFDVVTHGHVSESYFYLLQKGLDDAAQDLRVDVDYFNSMTPNDEDAILENILAARRSLRNGLAVSFVEHTSALGNALREASFDMPVLSMLLDEGVYDGIDIDTFANLGFSYQIAGLATATRFQNSGVDNALCFLEDNSLFGQQNACNAFATALGNEQNATRNAAESSLVRQLLSEALEDGVQAILTVTPELFATVHEYLADDDKLCSETANVNNSDCVMLATIGENEEILQAIVNEEVSFAMDSQHYALGYLSILFLSIRSRFDLLPGAGRFTLTGPLVIDTKEEAERRLSRDILKGESIENRTAEDLDVRFIVHGKTSDPFWNEVKSGVRVASRNTGVGIDFRHPDSALTSIEDIVQSHITMLQEAEEDGVDAIVMTLPTNDTDLLDAVRGIVERTRIPIITINAGHRWFREVPIQAHVGMAEVIEGRDVAERLADVGVTKALCVIFEKGNMDLEERCREIGSGNSTVEIVVLDSTDEEDFHTDMPDRTTVIKDAVVAALDDDEEIQAVISTGLVAVEGVREAIAELDRFCKGNAMPENDSSGCVEFVGYDIGELVFTYILNDEMLFAVDQQPELQGYLPVFLAMMEVLWANRPIGLISTGPRFVDLSNVIEAETLFGFLASS